jgi:cytochrome c
VGLLAGLAIVALAAAGCGPDAAARAAALTGGKPERGGKLIQDYGCGGCHVVPGVTGAEGAVGPPLSGIASRSMLAGRLPNNPTNMIRWIRQPQEVEPGTAMPDLHVSESDGRDIAAYLYTLQ